MQATKQKRILPGAESPKEVAVNKKNPFLEIAQNQLLEVETPPNCGCFQLRQLAIVKQSDNSNIQFQRSLANKSANAILEADFVST